MKGLIALAVAGAVLASACGTNDETSPTTSDPVVTSPTTSEEPSTTTTRSVADPPNGGPQLVNVGLRTFPTCDDILDYYIENALEQVGPYGLGGPGVFYGEAVEEMAVEEAASDSAVASSGSESSRSFTGTNVQVAGVDEADLVKTDGRYIYSLLDYSNRLRIVEVDGGSVETASSLDLGFAPREMLLHEDTLLLLSTDWRVGPVTHIALVDVSDRESPRLVAELNIDGTYNGSRLTDGIVRVVITSSPVGIEWESPRGSGLRAEREAIEANKELVRNSTLGNWLPAYVLNEGGEDEWGELLDCSNVLAPGVFSGLNTLSILLFDLDASGISEWEAAGVVAEGDTVYATAESVYVATARWVNWRGLSDADIRSQSSNFTTLIHKFDTSSTANPTYEASGEVSGFLLNQFSMDEYQGDLRVAATTSPSWWWSEESESHVTVLRPEGEVLRETGSVWGLGEGERIFSVRFMGPDGYVVTFRQVDPLYALDLSDPFDPRVLGELKIPGFSSYLHPVGDDLLLGVGQEASLEGRVEGLQMSLFDVSDPTDPRRIAQVRPLQDEGDHPDSSWSPVENDHRAFVFFEDLALVPYSAYWWEESDYRVDAGVVVIEVGSADLSLRALLRPFADGPVEEGSPEARRMDSAVPQRAIIIDEWVYSITYSGVAVHRMDTWERVTFLAYPLR